MNIFELHRRAEARHAAEVKAYTRVKDQIEAAVKVDWAHLPRSIEELHRRAERRKAHLDVGPTSQLRQKLKEEKDRRIYYQSIVYTVCTLLDEYLQTGVGIVCGTVDDPSDEVQTVLKYLLESIKERN